MVIVRCPKCGEVERVKVNFTGLFCETCDKELDMLDLEFEEKEIYQLLKYR